MLITLYSDVRKSIIPPALPVHVDNWNRQSCDSSPSRNPVQNEFLMKQLRSERSASMIFYHVLSEGSEPTLFRKFLFLKIPQSCLTVYVLIGELNMRYIIGWP
jgi:hypothetical protein